MTLQQPGQPRPTLARVIGDRLGQRPPLLPTRRSRSIAAVMIVISAATIAVIGVLVHGGSGPDALDRAVENLIKDQWATSIGHDLRGAAQLGSGPVATVLTALLCYTFLAQRRYSAALLVALAMPIAGGLSEFVLKPLVHRAANGFLTYPSGHATAVFALITCIALLLLAGHDVRAPRAFRIVLTVTVIALGCTVCVGLVLAHLHYFTDTIGGAAVGTGVTLAVAFAIDRATARTARRHARAAIPEQARDRVGHPGA